MPELPDIAVYIDALRPRVVGRTLTVARIKSPFLVRTFEPEVDAALGRRVQGIERIGKRIVLGFEGELYYVFHLMIAGRFLWKPIGTRPTGKIDVAAFDFENEDEPGERDAAREGVKSGTLVLTEASPKKRASLHVIAGREGPSGLASLDPGGVEPLGCTLAQFTAALTSENRTLKRAMTDPRTFSGIGNAYSDEILHAARLSPVRLTQAMKPEETARLHEATRVTLLKWIEILRREFGIGDTKVEGGAGRFPKSGEITAFRPDFVVHGKYGKPCSVCGSPVQRIVRGENETNYCATCQTSGKLLADRSLSRLLKEDWPETVEEWERVLGTGVRESAKQGKSGRKRKA